MIINQFENVMRTMREETNRTLQASESALELMKVKIAASKNLNEKKVMKTQEAKIGKKFSKRDIVRDISNPSLISQFS